MPASNGWVSAVLLCMFLSLVSAKRNPLPVLCDCHNLVSQSMVGRDGGEIASEACLPTNWRFSVDTH